MQKNCSVSQHKVGGFFLQISYLYFLLFEHTELNGFVKPQSVLYILLYTILFIFIMFLFFIYALLGLHYANLIFRSCQPFKAMVY